MNANGIGGIMAQKNNPMDQMSELLASSMLDIGAPSAEDQIRKFETIAIGVMFNMVIGSLPDEVSKEMKETIYQQWREYVTKEAGNMGIMQSMLLNSLGKDVSDLKDRNPINSEADAHVRRIIFGESLDKE